MCVLSATCIFAFKFNKMKKLVLISTLLSSNILVNAQVHPKTVAVKPQASKPVLKTLKDSVSYVLGVSFTNFYKEQGILVPGLNSVVVSNAIADVLAGKPSVIDNVTANNVMNKYLTLLQIEKVKPTIDAGQQFLAKNKLRPGVKTTASGLQYEVLREGTGIKPSATDSVTCNYKGTYINEVEFDNSYKRGHPITFSLGGVIRGWTEGLQLMPVGSKYKFYVPYNIGYGVFDYNGIPGGSALLFEIELLDVKKGVK